MKVTYWPSTSIILYIGSVLGSIGIGYFLSCIIYTQINLKSQIFLIAGIQKLIILRKCSGRVTDIIKNY